MQPFYQTLDYEHSAIQQQAAQLALNLNLVHNPITVAYTEISLDLLYNEIPTIRPLLNLYNFTVKTASLTVLKELATTGIYSEIVGPDARLEIPVIGCEYGYTAYYANAQRIPNILIANYWKYHSEGAEEVARVTMRKPTVINTKIPRATVVTRRHVRRISLMLDVGNTAYSMLTNTD